MHDPDDLEPDADPDFEGALHLDNDGRRVLPRRKLTDAELDVVEGVE